MRLLLRSACLLCSLLFALRALAQWADPGPTDFAKEVDRRLVVPPALQARYAKRIEEALAREGVADPLPQYFLLVDRTRRVQGAFVYWRSPEGDWSFIGAAPVSTGRPGEYEHFLTPLGVFAHSLGNMDFRAEGTKNELGVMGYGNAGMRVYDFGWMPGERTWDKNGKSAMRLQVHSTRSAASRVAARHAALEGLHPHSGLAQRISRPPRHPRPGDGSSSSIPASQGDPHDRDSAEA